MAEIVMTRKMADGRSLQAAFGTVGPNIAYVQFSGFSTPAANCRNEMMKFEAYDYMQNLKADGWECLA